MKIRNSIELFYAANILINNNLSALMLDIDPQLLEGKRIAKLLMDDQGKWSKMKKEFREVQIRDRKLKLQVLDELRAAGLRIVIRSKKTKQVVYEKKEKIRLNHSDQDEYNNDELVDGGQNRMTISIQNSTEVNEQDYEEEDLDSADDADDFEQVDNIRNICDEVVWNVMKNDSQVYMLAAFLRAEKVVCSLSDVEPNVKYDYVCEYVSRQGQQILIGLGIVIFFCVLSLQPFRWSISFIVKLFVKCCKTRCGNHHRKKTEAPARITTQNDQRKLEPIVRTDDLGEITTGDECQQQLMGDHVNSEPHRPIIAEEGMKFL
ncbi:unnamed protein product [Didymodactylos carnosus]|uniref:Uncharacterized protein n=1 Tax=Didymodactylos carnosus TaxID=1234261 RepID=A0A814WNL6_9BILA|nr:unnamed protein product [Didymodactylos carnosus]CAF1200798.1 unnamed protein product [Didymodactylos carnosus]CAF3787772.1 unnamed protein product [Didymodactylos carnosus]CAF3965291.1 unnamed protein product [Didymodactylos carnosus]